jgi:hypothetical protein
MLPVVSSYMVRVVCAETGCSGLVQGLCECSPVMVVRFYLVEQNHVRMRQYLSRKTTLYESCHRRVQETS